MVISALLLLTPSPAGEGVSLENRSLELLPGKKANGATIPAPVRLLNGLTGFPLFCIICSLQEWVLIFRAILRVLPELSGRFNCDGLAVRQESVYSAFLDAFFQFHGVRPGLMFLRPEESPWPGESFGGLRSGMSGIVVLAHAPFDIIRGPTVVAPRGFADQDVCPVSYKIKCYPFGWLEQFIFGRGTRIPPRAGLTATRSTD